MHEPVNYRLLTLALIEEQEIFNAGVYNNHTLLCSYTSNAGNSLSGSVL